MLTKDDIEHYFLAEKSGSWGFMAIGIAGILTAVIFYFVLKTSFYKAAAIPLLAVGLMMGIVGYNIYKKSDEDRKRNVYALTMNPGELKEKELPRMEAVMKNFVIMRYVEIALALAGIGLFVYLSKNELQLFWKGFGAGLAIMTLLALTADYFAERRGSFYTKQLKEFTKDDAK